ncbi:MAG: response regulator [Saprospiraceae bacterium]|nr:response regulator [Saprospiraceae bacterium]
MKILQRTWMSGSLLMLLAIGGLAQASQIRFEHITSEHGLSENVVNCIFQDSKGFIWVGTNDGLNRYDGYHFRVFNPAPDDNQSINSNLIFAINEDLNGNIWIGTTGSGLNKFDPRTETFEQFQRDPQRTTTLSNDQVTSLYTDRHGRLWVGTLDGLNVILPDAQPEDSNYIQPIAIAAPNALPVNEITEDKAGNIWMATRLGLYKCDARDLNGKYDFRRIDVAGLVSRNLKSIEIDAHGRLVVGGPPGVYYQTGGGAHPIFEQIGETINVQSILTEGEDKVWVGTYTGLQAFKLGPRGTDPELIETFNPVAENPYSLNKNVIRALQKDRSGIIWVGTSGGGLNKFDPSRKPFFHFGQNLRRDGNRYTEIRSMLEDSYGNLWVGTEGGGLFWYPGNTSAAPYAEFYSIPSSASVFALEEIQENGQTYLLVGSEDTPTLRKLLISATGAGASEVVPGVIGSVFSILQDERGIIWVGTYNKGLERWLPKEGGGYTRNWFTKEDGDLANDIVRRVFEDAHGNIWIGTAKGLHKIEAAETTKEHPEIVLFQNTEEDARSLSHNYVLDIFESSSGYLWIGTFGGGLNQLVYEEDGRGAYFKRYWEKDGLPSNTIKGILEDEVGQLWLTGNGGLSKFDPETETFQNYSTTDGLQSAEFFEAAKAKRMDGSLLFGGVNGFNAFLPQSIQENTNQPKVVFTRLLVHNQEVAPNEAVNGRVILDQAVTESEGIQLAYRQNDFSVEFAALHFADPQKNEYAFKLEGYHEDWIEVGAEKRYATFTNLPHGNYTLLVKASNADRVWDPEPARLQIRIKPPFWLAWPAYVLYGVLIVGALWLFRRYTIINVKEKHQLMLEHMEREKLEELNQMKLRFFTNISHELRTPLTLIISPLEFILEKGKTLSSENLQQQYHYMYKNAKYLLRLVNQLLDFRKLDQGSLNVRVRRGDIKAFIENVTQPFQFLANKKSIDFDLGHSESDIYTFFDPDLIEKIMYNLLSNAFKFTPAGGTIRVEVKERYMQNKSGKDPFVEIRVQDDGIGISRSQQKKIFERFHKGENKKMNKDGAGIGLAYTKSLVELHHGAISAESIKGKGSCFIVILPMNKNAYLKSEIEQGKIEQFQADSDPLEYLVAEPVAEVSGASIGMNSIEQEKELPLLLFVDDNADIRSFIKEGFQNDFRIIEAEDGELGYEVALSSLPDIIVSDVMMPNMDGIELCKHLKTNPLTSHIPIVLLTAKSADEDELEGLRTGADAYVVKPFKLDILRAQLMNTYLQRERLKQRFRQEVLLQPEEITVTTADEEFLKRAVSIIEDHMSDSEFNVEALVKEMFLSRSKLYLKLKALTGQSSSEFIRTIRLKRAIQLLEKSDYTIKEIMFMTGFNTASYFSKCFKNQFGVVPSEYLKQKKKRAEEMPLQAD